MPQVVQLTIDKKENKTHEENLKSPFLMMWLNIAGKLKSLG
jgi:hypothetical protein